jgi:predicted NBD/HSP70 family sugar kinase
MLWACTSTSGWGSQGVAVVLMCESGEASAAARWSKEPVMHGFKGIGGEIGHAMVDRAGRVAAAAAVAAWRRWQAPQPS